MFSFFFRPYMPGFRVRPRDDTPGFNVDEKGFPAPSATQAAAPYSIGIDEPGPEFVVQSALRPSMAGFRVSSQNGLPSFNVTPSNDAPSFNPDEGAVQRQDTTWPTQEFPAPANPEEPTTPDPLLRTAWPPSVTPVDTFDASQWPSPNVIRSAETNIPMRVTAAQNTSPQSVARDAMWNAWPQPSMEALSNSQQGKTLPRVQSVVPPSYSNFILANAGNTGERLVAQQKMARVEQEAELNASSRIEPYPRQEKVDDRQPISNQREAHPYPNGNGDTSYAAASNGPSLGQRLVRSSIETIVPGAHYQELARQQIRSGNYVGAGVYQAAALVDATLGAATLGLSTRLAAAGRVAAVEGAALFRRAFHSRSQFIGYLRRAPKDMQWHHIVEQSKVAEFGPRRIQSIENIVAIPIEAHRRLNAFYSSKRPFTGTKTVREWLRGQSFEAQYEFGMQQLKQVLGY